MEGFCQLIWGLGHFHTGVLWVQSTAAAVNRGWIQYELYSKYLPVIWLQVVFQHATFGGFHP